MKMNGKKIEGPSVEVVVIPRDSGDLVFKCQAILDYEVFEKILPEPQPPTIILKGQKVGHPDFEDIDYKKELTDRSYKRFQWMILKSLEATDGLEFETVSLNDPSTWNNLESELKSSGLSPVEIGLIYQGVTHANGMNEDKLKQARERFFALTKEAVSL